MQRKIFLSYSSPDQEWAEFIGMVLVEMGYSVKAMYNRSFHGLYAKEIDKAVQESDDFIFVISPNFEKSNDCKNEWSLAYNKEKMETRTILHPVKVKSYKIGIPSMSAYDFIDVSSYQPSISDAKIYLTKEFRKIFKDMEVGINQDEKIDVTSDKSAGIAPLTVSFACNAVATLAGYCWDFGDGTISTEQNPAHVYENPGIYSVKLTLTTKDGPSVIEKKDLITINEGELDGDFIANKSQGIAPFNVLFKSHITSKQASYYWDFGDGTISTEQNPAHVYLDAGIYTVTLHITSKNSSKDIKKKDYIKVKEGHLKIDFTADRSEGNKPLTVSFRCQANVGLAGYFWDFGDCTTSNEQDPVHHYLERGTYSVTLTVTTKNEVKTIEKKDLIIVT